ncbi:FG-GAP-like repeat-containing protein [Isoptericola croceus]|uniref:FG-GAP-like repeat-containing protein n=1 Tax=Isoptericola croceus TaxID=3031406 RepID=UPI0023F87C51|nr:FG-GAP-like repeat-containing protein [Isoptericola croceus]
MSRERRRRRATGAGTAVAVLIAGLGIGAGPAQGEVAEPLPAPPPGLERVSYGNTDLTVDLGVGLWAWPMPMDVDDDGVNDLLVSSPDKPYNGLWYFRNEGTNADPLFEAPVRLSNGLQNTQVSHVDGEVLVTRPNRLYLDVTETGFAKSTSLGVEGAVHEPDLPEGRLRGDQWYLVDFTGNGARDVVVGVGDWSEYGWDAAYDENGTWTNGPLHGYVYLLENTGTTDQPVYADPVKIEAGGKPIDVYGAPSPVVADFNGNGALDIITGEFLDSPTFFQNVGTRTEPEYAAGRGIPLTDGSELELDLQMLIVTTIDWDGDGHPDLVIGEEDGRVSLVRNTGVVDDGAPVFEPPEYFQQRAESVKVGALATPTAVDWNGDGREDIIAGDTAGRINFVENLGGDGRTPVWAEPVRLEGGGAEIRHQAGPDGSIQGPAEAKWGYTVPVAADWNHNGLPDLLVNNIWGKVVWYENVGTRTQPELAPAQPVEVEWEGAAPKPAWNWWDPEGNELVTQWRTTPFVTDLDGDGLNDLVMLDHEGYLAYFQRAADGMLRPGERIFIGEEGSSKFERGNGARVDAPKGPLQLNASEDGQSGRRKFVMTDWTGNGRLDILMNGTNVQLLENVGTQDEPWLFRLAGDVANGQLAGHTTAPTIVNWDGDTTPDLLIGAEDGHFYHQPWNFGSTLPERRPETPAEPGEIVGAWNFDEGEGHVARDSSGHGNDGIVDGARWVSGHRGTALKFDAFNDYVDLSYQAGPHLEGAPGATLTSWVNIDSLESGAQRIFGTRINGGTAGFEVTFENVNGTARVAVAGRSHPGDAYRKHQFLAPVIKPGQWHHLAAVLDFEEDAVRLFVDGVEQHADESGRNFRADAYEYGRGTQPDAIGRSPDGGAYFRGSLDDMALYRTALDQRQIILDALTADVDRFAANGDVVDEIERPLGRLLSNARRHLAADEYAEAREQLAAAQELVAGTPGERFVESAARSRILGLLREYLYRAEPPSADSEACKDPGGAWAGSWRSAPAAPRVSNDVAAEGFADESLRMVARVTTGGCDVRVRLSNEFGDQDVTFDSVIVGLHDGEGRLVPGSARTVTFNGEDSVLAAPGSEVVSDPVGMAVGDRAELAVSFYLPEATGPATTHNLDRENAYVAAGDRAAEEDAGSYRELGQAWMFLGGIDVQAPADQTAVAVVGDSLTDGLGSSVGAEHTWPDVLADRLLHAGADTAVLNRGVAAGRLLRDAAPPESNPLSLPGGLRRLQRDADDDGVSTVILYLGINDIIRGGEIPSEAVTAEDLITGYREYAAQAREHGVRVIGATLTPYGSSRAWTRAGEDVRQEVNAWIRNSGELDGMVDLDAAVRAQDDPSRIDPRFDYRDGLHFNDAGYAAMAEAVDLALLAG